jgi:DNA polymerase III epsilon subunit-like protein
VTAWWQGTFCGFDLETTGVDVEADRIVTSCVVACGGGIETDSRTWLADPGVEIPEEAAKVHGISTEQARAEGRPAAEVVAEIVEALAEAAVAEVPIVAMNAAFDLTILDREAMRHDVKPLFARTDAIPMVIDPRVLDKQVDRYRRGGRTLTDLCRHYSVPLDGAHAADADAIAACRVAWRIGQLHRKVGALTLEDLHEAQVAWAREQAESLADYFRRTPGKESWADGVRTEWPLIPGPRGGER